MKPGIHVFIETWYEGEWMASAAHTFTLCALVTLGSTEARMAETSLPADPLLHGLLCDEAWESLPWSFFQKGFPDDASPQVKAVSESWSREAFGHTYLTLQELVEKYVELLADPRALAKRLREPLSEVIYALSAGMRPDDSPEHRRIVMWFNTPM